MMAAKKNHNADPTFGKYTAEQARQYAIGRAGSYPAELYTSVLQYHDSTGGHMHEYVDVGCGPGKATQDLAPLFDTAIGTDHSQAMIEVARSADYKAKNGPIHFAVAAGEDFDLPGLEPGSVDLITSAMAVGSRYWNIISVDTVLGPLVRHGQILERGSHSIATWRYSSTLDMCFTISAVSFVEGKSTTLRS